MPSGCISSNVCGTRYSVEEQLGSLPSNVTCIEAGREGSRKGGREGGGGKYLPKQ